MVMIQHQMIKINIDYPPAQVKEKQKIENKCGLRSLFINFHGNSSACSQTWNRLKSDIKAQDHLC